jgi:hypothetical protein
MEESVSVTTETPQLIEKPRKPYLPRCSRCMAVFDSGQEPYEYSVSSKLCQKCKKELGLGQNQDVFLGGKIELKPAKRSPFE